MGRLVPVEEISGNSFSFCTNLKTVLMPENPTYIGQYNFMESAPEIYLIQSVEEANSWPATVTDIAMNAFMGWTDKQVIQTEFYSDAIPATWLSWASVKATVKYCGAIVDLKINNAGSAAADVTVKAPFNAAGRTNLAAVLNQAGLPDLSYDGYAFTNRWYREATCQNEVLTTDNITEDTTLYARWDKYYTVTLVTEQAGVVNPDDVQPLSHVWDGTLFEALGVASPASDSHNFTKWYTDEARTSAFDASTPIQSNLTLYAGWDVKKHSVSFVTEQNGVLNPGGIAAKTDVPYGTVFGTLGVASPSSDSHNFTRWYADQSRTVAFDASTPIRGDMTLYAGWSIKRFTINFINNGHVHFYESGKLLTGSKTYDYGYNLKFTVSVSNGYKFDSISHNNEILSPQNGVYSVTVTAAGDIKVNNERGIVYTIVYDANGGSGFIEPQYGIVYDTYVKLKDSAFGRTGYYVACWQTEAGTFKAGQGTSAAGNSYALNTSYKNLANEDNDTVTLFAVWKPVTYTIQFVSNKPGNTAGVMSGNMADCVFTYDVGKHLPANGYTLTGWHFTGWSLTPGEYQPVKYNDEEYILNRFGHQNTVLYAQWVKDQYKIEHELSGYTPEFWYYINYDGKQDITLAQYYTLPVKYDIDSNIIFGRPGIQGYSAVWNIPSVTPGSRTGDITIKATWSEITYTVYHHVEDSDQPGFEKEETFQMRYTEIKDIWAWSRTGVIDRQFVNWEVKAGYMSFSNAILEYGLNATLTLNDVNHSVDDPNKGYGLRIEKFGYIENAYVHLIEHTMNNACVAEGSMITLADGSQKAVEQLTGDELLLVWNMKTGTFDVAPILFIDREALRSYEITHLYFSDGTEIKVINEHGFWNFDLNQYVFLRNDAAKYVGHWFNKQTTDTDGNLSWTKVQLVQVQVYFTETTAWSPVTAEHLCYYVNGMLSMPGATEGLINIFEVDGEAMQYDPDALTADIEKYGLFTYEEFAELIPVTEEVFNIFGGQYLKVSIGKGLIDMETIASLIERYSALL